MLRHVEKSKYRFSIDIESYRTGIGLLDIDFFRYLITINFLFLRVDSGNKEYFVETALKSINERITSI